METNMQNCNDCCFKKSPGVRLFEDPASNSYGVT